MDYTPALSFQATLSRATSSAFDLCYNIYMSQSAKTAQTAQTGSPAQVDTILTNGFVIRHVPDKTGYFGVVLLRLA